MKKQYEQPLLQFFVCENCDVLTSSDEKDDATAFHKGWLN